MEMCDFSVYNLQDVVFYSKNAQEYLEHANTRKLDYSLFNMDTFEFHHLKSSSVQLSVHLQRY